MSTEAKHFCESVGNLLLLFSIRPKMYFRTNGELLAGVNTMLLLMGALYGPSWYTWLTKEATTIPGTSLVNEAFLNSDVDPEWAKALCSLATEHIGL